MLRSAVRNTHLRKSFTDGAKSTPNLRLADVAYAADAKAVGDGQLSRIDDDTARAQMVLEGLEYEGRISRHMEGHDYWSLKRVRQQGLEAKLAHAIDENSAIARVACTSALDAAFFLMLFQRLVEGYDDMGGRRETPLSIFFHRLPLIIEVER